MYLDLLVLFVFNVCVTFTDCIYRFLFHHRTKKAALQA